MLSPKKLLIIAVIVIILIAIPLTLYLLQQQQEVRSHAQAASTLSFSPDSNTSAPIQAKVDDPIDLDLYVDPSSNLVSIVRLEIQYDSSKLATSAAEGQTAFENNSTAFPSILEGPVYQDGKVDVTLSIGSDPTKAISVKTKIGTIHLKALATTTSPTQVVYSTTETKVLSLAGPDTGSSDQASENVLSSTTPAIIAVVGPSEPSVTPEVTDTPTPEVTETPSETPSPSPTATTNQPPVCTTLTATPSAGTAPLDVVFTATGEDPDGSISKFSFNFGDGSISTVTADANSSSNSATTEHTYTSGGSFTASAVMTDNAEGTSTNSCSQLISIEGPAATPSATITDTPTGTPSAVTDTPTPTLPSPGPGATIIGLGAFFSVLSVIGAILFFAL